VTIGNVRRGVWIAALASVACGEVTIHLLPGLGQDGGASDAATSIDPSAEAAHQRADDALATLLLNFLPTISSPTGYDGALGMYWDAVFDAADRRGANAFPGTAQMFFDIQRKRLWLGTSYEAEAAIALALLHGSATTNNEDYLTQAQTIYADIMGGWDTSCCGAHPGGIWSTRGVSDGGAPTDKTAVANLPAVIAGARLYTATGNATYLAFATQVLDYWTANMIDLPTGHVFDRIHNDGTVDATSSFTYDHGFFIGAIVELARASGDSKRIPLAQTVARYILANEVAATSLGPVLNDHPCTATSATFKGVAARYLGELFEADPSHTEYRNLLVQSAEGAWSLGRDPASGDISCGWTGPPDASAPDPHSLGSAAVALAAAAEALGPGAHRPPLTYEAEEGNLHGVSPGRIGLGHDNPGYTGWGYVAGWGFDGESVDIPVIVPAAGSYQITMRYATGADAIRVLSVNGVLAASSIAFPSTGGYGTYARVQATVALISGANEITLAYSAAGGSIGYLNFDQIVLTPR
jgi:predicted alpha-1,6-mannanase (GH76 family)